MNVLYVGRFSGFLSQKRLEPCWTACWFVSDWCTANGVWTPSWSAGKEGAVGTMYLRGRGGSSFEAVYFWDTISVSRCAFAKKQLLTNGTLRLCTESCAIYHNGAIISAVPCPLWLFGGRPPGGFATCPSMVTSAGSFGVWQQRCYQRCFAWQFYSFSSDSSIPECLLEKGILWLGICVAVKI
jgi:hypothetical protein